MLLKLISWNVNGIRAAGKKGLWPWIAKDQADIYCFQETKAREEQVPADMKIPHGYRSYWNSAVNAGYAGVATFSRPEVKSVIKGDRDNDWDDEGRVLITKYDEFTLLNVYFPNGQRDKGRLNYKLKFYDYFLKYIDDLRDQGEKVIFCGDVNTAHSEIDLARPKENKLVSGFLAIERQWIDKVISHAWSDTFRYIHGNQIAYSWWSQRTGARGRNIGWRIDYFFIDQALRSWVKDAFILPDVLGSDHCPIGLKIKI